MNTLHLFRLELGRLLHGKKTWLAILLALAVPFTGYRLFPMLGWTTMATLYLANPISVGTLGATLIFSVLTLYELNRIRRSHAIMESVVSLPVFVFMLTAGLICFALLTALLGFLLYLPYTLRQLGLVFSLSDYFLCWFLLFFPGAVFGVLAAASCFLITQRTEVSFLAVIVFLVISITGERADIIWWHWSLPALPALSDDFSNALVFRTAVYSRGIWFCILGGSFLAALLCIRKYQKNLLCSFLLRLRRPYPAVLAVCMVSCGVLLWKNQPFFDHSPSDWLSAVDEHPDHTPDGVFLTGTEAAVTITDTVWGSLSGSAVYHIENTTGKPQTLYFHLNTGYTISSAKLNGSPVELTADQSELIAMRDIVCPLPETKDITLELTFGGSPRIWNTFASSLGSNMISSRYIELAGYDLTPVPQIETKSEDAPFLLQMTLPEHLTPVTTGYEAVLLSENKGCKIWKATDSGTASMRLFAADYVKAELSGGDIPIEFYYSKKHQKQLEEIGAIPTIEAAVAYCTEHYGPRSFEKGKPYKILQCSEFMFGGFAAANVSGTLEESFTVKNLKDTDKGSSGAEVLAHEIIHQWWGLGVMFMDMEDPFWTSEGLTTYSSYRLLEELYGEEYAKSCCLDKWTNAVTASQNNFYARNPQYFNRLPEALAANIRTTINSVNLYDGTALMIKRAEEQVGGREEMDAILSRLYREGGELPQYISLNDFLNACGLTKEDVGRD